MEVLRNPEICSGCTVHQRERTSWFEFLLSTTILRWRAYVISRQIVKQLYGASRSTSFFCIDDVYGTEFLPEKIPDRIDPHVNLLNPMTLEADMALASYKNQTQPIAYDIVHVYESHEFIARWNALLDRLTYSQKKLLLRDVSKYKIL